MRSLSSIVSARIRLFECAFENGRRGLVDQVGQLADEVWADGNPGEPHRGDHTFDDPHGKRRTTKALSGRAEPQRPFPSPWGADG